MMANPASVSPPAPRPLWARTLIPSLCLLCGLACDGLETPERMPLPEPVTDPSDDHAEELRFQPFSEEAGFHSLELFGGHGIQVADVDGDGWLDVYVTHIFDPSQDRPDLLFLNQRRDPPAFEEIGQAAGVADDGFFVVRGEDGSAAAVSEESHAAVFADLDNDGDFDLFNAHTWSGHNRLYRNEGGGRFVDLTESAGIDVTDIGTRGVGAADLDGDGLVDIVLTAWQNAQPVVYWNLGGLRFARLRVQGADNRAFANQGITIVDFDGDRQPDIALTSFEHVQTEGVGPVALLRNLSARFADVTDYAGIEYPQTSSDFRGANGWSFADVDNDGFVDVLVTGSHGARLYRNNGEGRFHLIRRLEGAWYTGAFGDVDNDGDLDLYLAGDSGLYLNDGRGGFEFRGGIGLEGIGTDARSAVFADANNDGALDLIIASKQGPNTFFLNRSRLGAWLKVELVAPSGEIGAIGSRVSLFSEGRLGSVEAMVGVRVVQASTGYCSQDPAILHFGVAANELFDLEVEFPDGTTRARRGLTPNQLVRVDGREP